MALFRSRPSQHMNPSSFSRPSGGSQWTSSHEWHSVSIPECTVILRAICDTPEWACFWRNLHYIGRFLLWRRPSAGSRRSTGRPMTKTAPSLAIGVAFVAWPLTWWVGSLAGQTKKKTQQGVTRTDWFQWNDLSYIKQPTTAFHVSMIPKLLVQPLNLFSRTEPAIIHPFFHSQKSNVTSSPVFLHRTQKKNSTRRCLFLENDNNSLRFGPAMFVMEWERINWSASEQVHNLSLNRTNPTIFIERCSSVRRTKERNLMILIPPAPRASRKWKVFWTYFFGIFFHLFWSGSIWA